MRKTVTVAKFHLGLGEPLGLSTETTTASTSPTLMLNTSRNDPKELTTSEHMMSESEVAARFENRRDILQTACQRYANSSAFRKMRMRTVPLSLYHPVLNITVSYCPIPKISSTTWRKLFRSIHEKMKTSDVKETKVSRSPGRRDVLFVFVREPYGRLLSAYVDKLLLPNTFFWKKTGRYIIANFRQNASRRSIICGHDVTFPEFIKFFIHMQTTGEKRDGHFIPTHDHCRMCEHPYKYIGHLETLTDDMPFILKAIQSPVAYSKNFYNDILLGNARMVFKGMRKGVQQCMGLDEACRRLWKKWQIRGIISKSQRFPLTREETRNISLRDFEKTELAALTSSGAKRERTKQKKEALREAFASVPLEDRLKVQKLLFLDFEMFGFDPQADEVFPKEPYEPDPDFSYFDLYK